jgi:hypothetical protein
VGRGWFPPQQSPSEPAERASALRDRLAKSAVLDVVRVVALRVAGSASLGRLWDTIGLRFLFVGVVECLLVVVGILLRYLIA